MIPLQSFLRDGEHEIHGAAPLPCFALYYVLYSFPGAVFTKHKKAACRIKRPDCFLFSVRDQEVLFLSAAQYGKLIFDAVFCCQKMADVRLALAVNVDGPVLNVFTGLPF